MLRDWLVVGAFVRKGLLETGRHRGLLLFRLVMPFLTFIPLGMLARFLSEEVGVNQFIAVSGVSDVMAYLVFSILFWNLIDSQEQIVFALQTERWYGTLESLWAAPIPRWAILLGWSLPNLVVALLSSGVAMGLAFLVFPAQSGVNWLAVALTLGFGVAILYSLSFVLSGVVLRVADPDGVYFLVSNTVPVLCGASFAVTVLPTWLRPFSLAMPLTYVFDSVRGATLGAKTLLPLPAEIALLGVGAVLCPWIGYRVFRSLERSALQEGKMEHY